MPVTKDKATGKYRIGSGKPIYERKADADKAYWAYLEKREKDKGKR